MQITKEERKTPVWKRLLFSRTLQEKNKSHKVAYIALMTALTVVINALEIKLGGIQFSLTIFIAAFSGLYLGALSGFCCCFLGDMIGFFIHPFGEYSPWIGISTGLMAFIIALCVLPKNAKKGLAAYLALGCVGIFLICTCGITTVYLNRVWYASMSYRECLIMRLFVQGQVWNSVGNSLLTVVGLPLLVKVKPLRIIV